MDDVTLIQSVALWRDAFHSFDDQTALITGGAGFIGTNLADRLANSGKRVLIYDCLSRSGANENLTWLRRRHGDRIDVMVADIRDDVCLSQAIARSCSVFHLASPAEQAEPLDHFEINARGTLLLLETLRKSPRPLPLVHVSTSKVYGDCLTRAQLIELETRYHPKRFNQRRGVDERYPLQLTSRRGCAKGAADQYVLHYARSYDLPATVLRMGTVYGPHQIGTAEQGWAAHFIASCHEGERITIYGDGKQVRDLLYVDDAVEACLLAHANLPRLRGQAFNVGGGPENSLSLLEFLAVVEGMDQHKPSLSFADWRIADQLYYVTDFTRMKEATGWQPTISYADGIGRLYRWLSGSREASPPTQETHRLLA